MHSQPLIFLMNGAAPELGFFKQCLKKIASGVAPGKSNSGRTSIRSWRNPTAVILLNSQILN
jgi:hypothetical protein